jgi:hypothetical protein
MVNYKLIFIYTIIISCALTSCQKYRPESEFIELQKKVDSLEIELERTIILKKHAVDSLNDIISGKDSIIKRSVRQKKINGFKRRNRLNPIKKVEKVA